MNIKKLIYPDLLNGSIFKSLICFMLPLLISYVFQQLYNAVDTIIVGHYLREESLAAIGASAALVELIVGFGLGIGNGLSIVAARAFGANDKEKLKSVVAASLVITAAITLIIMIVANLLLRPVLHLLGTPDAILEEAYSYISLISIFCGVMFAYNLCAGMLRAIGNSFMPLIFLIISSLMNISLDIVFITKLNFGIKGAAVATVISQGFSVILCLLYICKFTKVLIPARKSFKFNGALYRDLIGQGLSMALMGSIVSSGTVILQSAINGFGTFIIAGHIAARKILSFCTLPIFTMGMASSTFVSQNLGAKKFYRIKKGVRCADLVTICWCLMLLIVIPLLIKNLIWFMSGSSNPEVLDYGSKYMIFATPFFSVLAVLIVTRNSLQGLGAKLLPLISSIMELLGKILFTALIIPHLGVRGIILCEPLIWCVMTIQLVYVYVRRLKLIEKQLSE